LLIHALRLDETANVVHHSHREVHGITPLFIDKIEFDLRSIEFKSFKSNYYCNFLFSRTSGSELSLAITVEGRENEMVRFRNMGADKEILEVSDKFVQLLRHYFANWLNQVNFGIRKQAEITSTENLEHLYAEACKNYAAAVRLNPDLHEAVGDWAVTLIHWAKLKEYKEAKRLFDEAIWKPPQEVDQHSG